MTPLFSPLLVHILRGHIVISSCMSTCQQDILNGSCLW